MMSTTGNSAAERNSSVALIITHTIKTGEEKRIRRMICVKCGADAFSPEQDMAMKLKQVAREMQEKLR
jgi:hypothetical protein